MNNSQNNQNKNNTDEYILAYDAGSTGLKALLISKDGTIHAASYQQYTTYYPEANEIEQAPMEWWEAICNTTKQIINESGISADSIKAVAPVGHQIMAIPVDSEGNLLRERILYCFDSRSTKQAKELLDNLGGYAKMYEINGVAHSVESLSITKAMWHRDNEIDLYNKTYKFLQTKSFIILLLTDKKVFVEDYGDASNTGWLDIKNKCYSKKLLDAAGIAIDKLPDIQNSHDIAGYVGKEAAKLTGLKEGTVIFTGTGDVPASCLGAGLFDGTLHYCSIGSANWNGGIISAPCLDSSKKMVNVCHLDKGYICFQYTAAGSVSKDWFENVLCDIEKDVLSCTTDQYIDIVMEKAKKSVPGSNGIIFIPYLRGGSGPHWNPEAKAAFVGLDMSHTKNDMARAVIEGLAYNFRWMMEQAIEVGVPFHAENGIRVIGGGARSDEWVQVYADVMGVNFHIIKDPQMAATKGGFMAAAVGLGWFDSYEEVIKKTVSVEKTIYPRKQFGELLQSGFEIFKEVYTSKEHIFGKMTDYQRMSEKLS